VEAISNTVVYMREPQGINARRVLTMMALILGFLLAGVSWLAYVTQVAPYRAEYPSLLSEITRVVFGHGVIGNILYFLVQAAIAAMLGVGGVLRFLVDCAVGRRVRRPFPFGTFTVNITAAALMGLVTGLLSASAIMRLSLSAGTDRSRLGCWKPSGSVRSASSATPWPPPGPGIRSGERL
jgi:hypothetical protein